MKIPYSLRPIINLLLAIGYLFGLLLVWIGMETITIERGWISLGIFSITLGILTWYILNLIGHKLARASSASQIQDAGL